MAAIFVQGVNQIFRFLSLIVVKLAGIQFPVLLFPRQQAQCAQPRPHPHGHKEANRQQGAASYLIALPQQLTARRSMRRWQEAGGGWREVGRFRQADRHTRAQNKTNNYETTQETDKELEVTRRYQETSTTRHRRFLLAG